MTEVHVARVDLGAPAQELHRRRDIQGLRALAVIMVVAFHARLPVPGGFTGVDVFFVISGFVITAMLKREFTRRGTIRLASFYGRRFLRLTPALALLVACVAVASALLQSPFGPQQATAETGIGAMLLAANLVIAHATGDYFATDAKFNPLLNTWSLSVEEQFYLVFPTILLICWWIGMKLRRPGFAAWMVLGISIASFWLCLSWTNGGSQWPEVTSWLGSPQSAAFYFSPARAWEFGVGALLAVALTRRRVISRSLARWSGLLGISMILLAAFGIDDRMAFPGYVALLPVIGTALVILAGCQHTTLTSRALGIGPLVAIGDVSYSWYLWHWPVLVFAAMLLPAEQPMLALAALASLIPALISYFAVEQPLRRWRPRRAASGAMMALFTIGTPVALCGALFFGAQAGWGVFDTRAIASAVAGEPSNADDPTARDDPTAMDDPTAAMPAGEIPGTTDLDTPGNGFAEGTGPAQEGAPVAGQSSSATPRHTPSPTESSQQRRTSVCAPS
jgi:peptidoglycan/LPS O-acetylase OafA/YrhL